MESLLATSPAAYAMVRCPACSTDQNEVIRRIQVVFARLINDANLTESGCCFVRNNLINLAQVQRSRVSLVSDANHVLRFALHELAPVLQIIA
jgi:hypothetical protein